MGYIRICVFLCVFYLCVLLCTFVYVSVFHHNYYLYNDTLYCTLYNDALYSFPHSLHN